MNRATRFLPGRRLRAAVGVSAVLLLASACASAPPAPVVPLEAARVAIISAEQADAGRYAAAELSEARQRELAGLLEPVTGKSGETGLQYLRAVGCWLLGSR